MTDDKMEEMVSSAAFAGYTPERPIKTLVGTVKNNKEYSTLDFSYDDPLTKRNFREKMEEIFDKFTID